MPQTGIEPVLYHYNRILSPARLPVPPLRHNKCGRWDLNPHDRNDHKILSLARLPVPTLPRKKWDLQGSNLCPPACKADALPAELRSHKTLNNLMIDWNNIKLFNDPDGTRTRDLRRDRAAL